MKSRKIISLLTSILLAGSYQINAQTCTSSSAPTPQLGAAMAPQYVNLWKHASAQGKYGDNYAQASQLSIGDNGWPISGRRHSIRFYP